MAALTFERPLAAQEMRMMMTGIMRGERASDDIRAFLTTLARRGETAEEIAAGVQVLREYAIRLPLSRSYELCDTCGTGGDGQGTINVSTLAALVAAAAGVRVAKHGNRAASSRCGSADLLEALGVNLQATPEQVARSIEAVGFGFCFAPAFHPAMKVVAPIRKALGIRTIFNLIGPLANPAPLAFQLVGVSERRLLQPMADALMRLGVRHGMVVHGEDGLDEVTTTGPTLCLEVRDGRVDETRLDPAQFGVPQSRLGDLRGGDAPFNAERARELLAGARSPVRDIIMVNAACAIYVAGQAHTIQEGMRAAGDVLASGRVLTLLEHVRALSVDAR